MVVVLIGLIVIALVWLNRRAVAERVLIGWLEARGVAAEVEVERIEFDRFVGRVRVGDPDNPRLIVERAEIDYAVTAPWAGGLGVRPSRVRLVRPRLTASYRDGRFSLGELDRIVEEFTRRPPDPEAAAPVILIEDGRLSLLTDYGVVEGTAAGRIDDGRLTRLRARLPRTVLDLGERRLEIGRVVLGAARVNGRLAGQVRAQGLSASGETAILDDLDFTLAVGVPYPQADGWRQGGPASLALTARAAGLGAAPTRLEALRLEADYQGSVRGWVDAFAGAGRTRMSLTAERAQVGSAAARALDASLDGEATLSRDDDGVAWRFDGPLAASAGALSSGDLAISGLSLNSAALALGGRDAALEASAAVRAGAARLGFGELRLTDVSAPLRLDVARDQALLIEAVGAVRGRGAWPLFGPVEPEDAPELVAMKAALADFALSADGLSVMAGDPGLEVVLTRPARIAPANGGVLTVTGAATPLYADRRQGGALDLTSTPGRGLPEMDFAVPDWRLTPDGFTARIDGGARLDFTPAQDVAIQTRGSLTTAGGRLTYRPEGCVQATVARLELGENDAETISGRLCEAGAPLLESAGGRWRARGAFDQASAVVPFLGAQATDAEGRFDVVGGETLAMTADIVAARLTDTLTPRRFEPLAAVGQARLADEVWSGGLDISAGAASLARVDFRHDGAAEAGGLTVAADAVRFDPQGLQPADLTPLAEGLVGTPVTGLARFEGRFDWTPQTATSSGVAEAVDLDFVSPVGPVENFSGRVVFDSLAPLTTAPDQVVRAEAVSAFAPLTDLNLVFELKSDSLAVSGGRVTAAGGVIEVEPFEAPLTPGQPLSGALTFEGVELGELLRTLGLGEDIRIEARVSGRLPFTRLPDGRLRIVGGTLNAVAPGRLSIPRTALDQVEAGGGGAEVPPNMVQDLAYQAMENLAFDNLSAELNSTDEGRMNIRFAIQGRHDPPQRQEIRLSVIDLIQQRFLDRELPLPSGTEIDLTLDLNINADELLSDLAALDRARRGETQAATP